MTIDQYYSYSITYLFKKNTNLAYTRAGTSNQTHEQARAGKHTSNESRQTHEHARAGKHTGRHELTNTRADTDKHTS